MTAEEFMKAVSQGDWKFKDVPRLLRMLRVALNAIQTLAHPDMPWAVADRVEIRKGYLAELDRIAAGEE